MGRSDAQRCPIANDVYGRFMNIWQMSCNAGNLTIFNVDLMLIPRTKIYLFILIACYYYYYSLLHFPTRAFIRPTPKNTLIIHKWLYRDYKKHGTVQYTITYTVSTVQRQSFSSNSFELHAPDGQRSARSRPAIQCSVLHVYEHMFHQEFLMCLDGECVRVCVCTFATALHFIVPNHHHLSPSWHDDCTVVSVLLHTTTWKHRFCPVRGR